MREYTEDEMLGADAAGAAAARFALAQPDSPAMRRIRVSAVRSVLSGWWDRETANCAGDDGYRRQRDAYAEAVRAHLATPPRP